MQIANPIYDVVFKYLMEDNKVAKIFLSAITELEILELEPQPQEMIVHDESRTKWKAYRLDFSAKIKTKEGDLRIITIEVQKSRVLNESMRFRKYIGRQYMKEEYFSLVKINESKELKIGIPILCIYFTGESIVGYEKNAVLSIETKIKDRYSQEELEVRSLYLESLFHQGIIINIPALSKRRRNEVEKILSIFDKENMDKDHHIMNVKETDFSEKFWPIIRRLQNAAQSTKVREVMTVEDEYWAELEDYRELVASKDEQILNEKKLKEEERKLKEEERKLKEEAIKKQEEAIKKQEEERKLKEEERKLKEELKESAIKFMIKNGIAYQQIADHFKLTIEEVMKIANGM
jgi:hypothetical protein